MVGVSVVDDAVERIISQLQPALQDVIRQLSANSGEQFEWGNGWYACKICEIFRVQRTYSKALKEKARSFDASS